jgi:hypothetical protein
MIKKITYNWRYAGNTSDELGEDYEEAEVGKIPYGFKYSVTAIVKWPKFPSDNGDTPHYKIFFENDDYIKVYNPNIVFYTQNKD